MRIGLFTDTYHPTINGITFVVESLKNRLQDEGHEVFVFCPARMMRPSKNPEFEIEKGSVIRIPSVKSGFFDDFDLALFFPPRILKQIRDMELDVIHIFTPSQIGLLGINAATKYDVPFVVQHSTDLYEFVEHYPNVLPGVLALVTVIFPMSVKLRTRDVIEIAKLQRPRLSPTRWGRTIIEKALTIVYSKADAAIALCRKSQKQLKSWQDKNYQYDITMMPSGVDALAKPKVAEVRAFRKAWNISDTDLVYGFVGRLAEEKNLPVLIKAFEKVAKKYANAKLLFVGDFEYRETLEQMASESRYSDRVIFTGFIPRTELGIVYEVMDVFAFPSLKDTQGWVLHEAAHAKKPIVAIDRDLSEVLVDGKNGFYARNNANDIANKIIKLFGSEKLRMAFGEESKKLALGFTEASQTKKVIKLYETIIQTHEAKKPRVNMKRFSEMLKRTLDAIDSDKRD